MNFLPDNYEVPSGTGNYTKLQQGTTKLRILSSPIIGFVRWEDNKPLRTPSKMTDDSRHFWAMKVYNYTTQSIEVWEVPQANIQQSLTNMARGSWGDPKAYDIEITKTGQSLDTKYQVSPCPPAQLSQDVQKQDVETNVDLQALWQNGDPFKTDDLPFTV